MGSIYTQILQKALAAGASPQTPHPIAREIAFGVCQSDTPGVRGANFHILAPGAINPRYATASNIVAGAAPVFISR